VWLAKNLAGAQLIQAPSTAAAVREVASDPRAAAIASRLASELYGVPIVRERIQDRADNVTRFVIVGTEDAPRTGNDKTTLGFSLHDGGARGALMRVLVLFDEEGVNLTRIESRPSREKPWDYVFLADVEGHREDANVARAVARLPERCPMVKHLGSYPRVRRASSS
jgi:chorismate mutase/prephenate dehydratase